MTLLSRLAADHRIELHELTTQRASLEAAFMELTEGSLDYQAGTRDAPASVETAHAPVGMETRA